MKTLLQSTIAKIAFVVVLLNLLLFNNASAALHGSYTINPSGGATATNYTNFASAINDMVNGTRTGTYNGVTCDGGTPNGSTVSASVTFTVSAGTYPEEVIIPAVSGVSSSITITFDGGSGNAATRLIQFSSSTLPVLEYNGCQWVTFKNLTFQNTYNGNSGTATAGTVVVFLGATSGTVCSNNTLSGCTITAPTFVNPGSSATSVTTPTGAAIYFGSVNTVSGNVGTTNTSGIYAIPTTGLGFFANNTITGCTINGGGIGVLGNGSSSSAATGNIFTNNTFSNCYLNSINLSNFYAVKIKGNTINTTINVGQGTSVYLTACGSSASDFTDFSGNILTQMQKTGLNLSSCTGTAAYPVMAYNNFIGGGLFLSTIPVSGNQMILLSNTVSGVNNDYVDIWDNSFNYNFASTVTTAARVAVLDDVSGVTTHLDIRNNIFDISPTTGTEVLVNYGGTNATANANISYFDNNIFFNNSSTTTYSPTIGATTFATTAALINGLVGSVHYNISSLAVNPGYTSNTNLHVPSASLQTGVATPTTTGPPAFAITTDIDGQTRPSPPHIGADDNPPGVANDLAISVIAPVSLITPGTNTISIQLTNTGTATQTSATLLYRLNGATAVSQAWTGSLAPGATSSTISLGTASFNVGGNTLKIYTNNSPVFTDTGKVTVYTTLNGVYTINNSAAASTTNFASFASAGAALDCGFTGLILGPVTFNVQPGTYTEQIQINAASGMGSSNPIKFSGGSDSTQVLLTFSATTPSSQYTVKLNGCTYVTFTNMKIRGTNSANAYAVEFFGTGTNNNSISNCSIAAPSFIEDNNVMPVVFSNSTSTSAGSGGTLPTSIVSSNNRIDSCKISGGVNGIGYYSATADAGIKFRYNNIINNYFEGIYITGGAAVKIQNNTIAPNNSVAGAGGIYAAGGANSATDYYEISANKITAFGFHGQTLGSIGNGIFIGGCNGVPTAPGGQHFLIDNNFIGGFEYNISSTIGIEMNSSIVGTNSFIDIWNNSINYSCAGGFFGVYSVGGDTHVTFKNNIVAATGTGTGSLSFRFDDNPFAGTADWDYNIYYNTTQNNVAGAFPNAATTVTMASIVGGGGYNVHSIAGGTTSGTNPNFVNAGNTSATDLHITALPVGCGRGVNLGLTTDIDGQTRAAIPNIGADELVVTVSPSVTSICPGGSGQLLTATGLTSFQWTPSAGLSATVGATVTANPTVNTTYTVTDVNGCTFGATAAITLSGSPVSVSVSANPSNIICAGTPVTFTATPTNGGTSPTYQWQDNGIAIGGQTNPTYTSSALVNGHIITVVLTSNATCITGNPATSTGITMTVNALPAISITSPASPVSYCTGGSGTGVAVNCSAGCSGIGYVWSPSTGLSATVGSSITANTSIAGTYTYTVIATNSSNCTASATTPAVTVNTTPAISITSPASPTSICISGSGTGLAASCSAGCTGIGYTWVPSTGLSATIGASITANPSSTGVFTYTVTGTNTAGCTATTVAPAITVNPLPTVSVSPSPAVICLGGSSLTALGSTATYSWTPSTGLTTTTGSTITATPPIAPSYTVTATSSLSCTAAAIVATSVAPPLHGTYTIDKTVVGAGNLYPNTTTFNSFATATAALACAGVNAATTFNVAAGTYAEQVIVNRVSGASLTNTVTFDGGTGNAATRIVQAGNSPNNAIILLDRASFINIKNLTVNSTVANGSQNSSGIELYGDSSTTACNNNSI